MNISDTHRRDARKLIEVINQTFNLDLMERTRKREYVDARMVFAFVILEQGASVTEVSRYLSMHHASVLHYRKKFPWLLKTETMLREKYEHVISIYNPTPTTPDVYRFTNHQLIQEVLRLRREVNNLISEKDRLLKTKALAYRNEERLAPLHKMIRERTIKGHESSVAHRLAQFYNGQT
tara:strand:+ start:311 stop:847 length:537 start_codon:yes stop_codon:yes gene_type:complete